jgi:hypothetical protein
MKHKTPIQIANEIYNYSLDDIKKDLINLFEKSHEKLSMNSKIGNKFVNYFTAPERFIVKSKRGISFYEFINNINKYNKPQYFKNFIKYAMETGNKSKITAYYDFFRLYFGTVSIFKPVIAINIYKKFKPQSVLNPCLGWGGTMVGASALGIPNFIGIDINKNNEPAYNKMIKICNTLSNTKIKIIIKDAIKVDYSKFDYDMVLTSPPYYNIEIYSNQIAQENKDEWDKNFYIPLYTKTYKNLKNGGYFIININIENYERVLKPLFGACDKKMKMPHTHRNIGNYTEYIYIWIKI